MTTMQSLFLMLCLVAIGSLSACAYLENAKQSSAFTKFCAWAPVAVAGIEQSVLEAQKDPTKLRVAEAMKEATGYLRLVAAQCEAPVVTVQ